MNKDSYTEHIEDWASEISDNVRKSDELKDFVPSDYYKLIEPFSKMSAYRVFFADENQRSEIGLLNDTYEAFYTNYDTDIKDSRFDNCVSRLSVIVCKEALIIVPQSKIISRQEGDDLIL